MAQAEEDHYDDGDSARERAGFSRKVRGALGERLGYRDIPEGDMRHRLDQVYMSAIVEEEGPLGPKCFTRRITEEMPVPGFQLARGVTKFDGKSNPKDWLYDYVGEVYLAGGNRRWAIRYIPRMLVGFARTWLNNLPPGSINSYLDFEKAFVSSFDHTYPKPNRAQELSRLVQGPNETDQEWLTRWNLKRMNCEGVKEDQAIAWFCGGCRHGTMLWQKLNRNIPTSLSALMKTAGEYALGDLTQPPLNPSQHHSNNNHVSFDRGNRQDFRPKR